MIPCKHCTKQIEDWFHMQCNCQNLLCICNKPNLISRAFSLIAGVAT